MDPTRSRIPFDGERTWLPDEEPGAEPTEEVPLAPDQVLGAYVDLGRIGEGATSEVRRVRDPALGRVLAMKILREALALRPDAVRRFEEEARITAAMAHPGVIPVHAIGHLEDGRPFFTMKEVRGRSLGTVLRQRRHGSRPDAAWTERRLIEAFHQICATVASAHARGVIHRDLKPDNILVGRYGEVLVVDWGLAKQVGQDDAWDEETERISRRDDDDPLRTRHGTVAGTPTYMSPEQARGEVEAVGFPSDVFALGAILYEIVRGYAPRRDPQPVTAAEPGTPLGIALRALAESPDLRHADAGELARELRHWLDGDRDREIAREAVDRARRVLPDITQLRAEAIALRTTAAEILGAIPADAPVQDKRPGWALEDQADGAEQRAAVGEAEALQLLRGALLRAPDLAAAHVTLAGWYRLRHAEAEERGDRPTAARLEAMLRVHDRGEHRAYLQAEGALTLVTDPPGATARLFRYERRDRQLVAVAWGEPLTTPIRELALPTGSWRVELTAPGRAPAIYPVVIGRLAHWDGVPPGGSAPLAVPLLPRDTLGPDDCYVPPGWAKIGGDPGAVLAWPGQRVWVDGFVIRRFPVTLDAWVAFLNGAEPEIAERHGEVGDRGPDLADSVSWVRGPDGWEVSPESRNFPATFLDWHGAMAFARWESTRTGFPWRLPIELEFEKAARGADGRAFPWGEFLDPTFCAHAGAFRGHPRMVPVDAFPVDESPYRVRGLAGGVRTWVLDPFDAHRPALDGRRARTAVDLADTLTATPLPRCERGGAWKLGAHFSRSAGRWWQSLDYRDTRLGLRLVRPV
jgi:serine/threonine-protein kinase